MTAERVAHTVAYGKAAQELALRRSEFDLAVHLGHVRIVPGPAGGRPGVPQEELDRLRAEPGFPEGLRDRVRTVGTAQAAELVGITADRFTRLARTGHFTPVAHYLNRYRAVVWLYLAREVLDAAARHPGLLTGRVPADLRDRLQAGEDARPRAWRARRRGLLLRRAPGAWEGAAVLASFLDPLHLDETVPDPYERARLERLRPAPPHGHPESPAARAVADRLLVADGPDELAELRTELAEALRTARAQHPASGPGAAPAVGAEGTPAQARPRAQAAPATGPRPGADAVPADTVAAAAHPGRTAAREPAGAAKAAGRVPRRACGRGAAAPPGPTGPRRPGAPRTAFLARLGLRRPRVG